MTAAYVYRCFDTDGRLVYVGLTEQLFQRLDTHYRYTWWAPQVARVRATVYPNRERARRVERTAILEERPRWNVSGVQSAVCRDSWAPENYHDYVFARRQWNVGNAVYANLLVAQGEYQRKFGGQLDIGPSPSARRLALVADEELAS